MRWLYPSVFAALLLCLPRPSYAQGLAEKQFQQRLLTEWKVLLENIDTARWEAKVEHHWGRAAKDLTLNRVEYIRYLFGRATGDLWASKVERPGPSTKVMKPESEDVKITNRHYSADLMQSKRRDGWVLSKLKHNAKGELHRYASGLLCPWMWLGTIDLRECLESPGFVIVRLEKLPGQDAPSIVR